MTKDRLTLDEYQALAVQTAVPLQHFASKIQRGVLGACAEAGEMSNLAKKHFYQQKEWDEEKFIEEMGDVLWYLAVIAEDMGHGLGTIARKNIDKLRERYPDGFQRGL